MRIIAISDIHAHGRTLRRLLEEQVILTKEDKLFLLGDYVHRGPSYERVFDYIIDLKKQGYQIQGLYGNHEFIWERELATKRETIPSRYLPFFKSLEFYIEYENFIFVHAGLNFNNKNPYSSEEDLVWIRNWYDTIDYDWLNERTIIHGHTPVLEENIRWRVDNQMQAIGIDNGCFVKKIPGMGKLCALDLTNWKLYFQENIG